MTKQASSPAAERSSSPLGQAWTYHVQGKDDLAIAEFNKLLEQRPDDIDTLYGLALSQKSAGQLQAALQNFQRVLDLLAHVDVSMEEAANRVTIMSRMVNQQIVALQETLG